jgi:hypothetical protein
MAPIVHGLEAKYQGSIGFTYLDVDDPATTEFKRAFGYRYQPEYYLLDPEGNVVNAWFGFVPPEAFESAFMEVLAGS